MSAGTLFRDPLAGNAGGAQTAKVARRSILAVEAAKLQVALELEGGTACGDWPREVVEHVGWARNYCIGLWRANDGEKCGWTTLN